MGICEYITKPRIKAAVSGVTPTGERIDGQYEYTDESPYGEGLARLRLRPTRLTAELLGHSRNCVRVRSAAPLCGRGRRVVDCATVSVH